MKHTAQDTITHACREALETLEQLRDELQDWLDNLPENLQDGAKGQALQEAIDGLSTADSSALELPPDLADELITFTVSLSKRPSRDGRRLPGNCPGRPGPGCPSARQAANNRGGIAARGKVKELRSSTTKRRAPMGCLGPCW